MKGLYFHRDNAIMKNSENGKWFATDIDGEFNTIDETKNAIDRHLGGTPTAVMPKRWLKDEKLKEYYNGEKIF